MSFLGERDMAQRALSYRGPGPRPDFPPASSRIRAAREGLGVSAHDFATRWGIEPSAYVDLEAADDQLFRKVAVAELPELAAALGLPLMTLLFGEVPLRELTALGYPDIARAIDRWQAGSGASLEQLSETVGSDLSPAIEHPGTLGSLSVQGVFDVCQVVGSDWLGLIEALARGDAEHPFQADGLRGVLR